ncbi:phosphatidate cytidylyltransferase [Ferrovibrio terrae]|uniref:phosphatidate cytidylyltransferase n=1 Tax=Ferrovibrio terrae TaxID=2594003 RepID=UPI003137FEE0
MTIDNSLKLRILSAAVMLPVAIGITWYGGPVFALLVLFAVVMMLREWLMLPGDAVTPALMGFCIVPLAVALSSLSNGKVDWAFMLLGVAAILAAGAFGKHRVWAFTGVIYAGLPSLTLVWLRNDPEHGRLIVFWLLVVVWSTDIGAYVAGRLIGGPKLIPSISPNKTWAGLLGGMLCAAIAGGLIARFDPRLPADLLAAFGAVVAVVAQAGDFTESAIKRHYNVKDSGTLIPGHGGVLDRLDGLLFAAPVVGVALLLWQDKLWP